MKRQLVLVITSPDMPEHVSFAPYVDLVLRTYLQALRAECPDVAFKMPSGLSLAATNSVLGQEHAD